MKPKAVLAYCREKGIKSVDIRFPDGLGRWKHFTIPASTLHETMFETGLSLEACSALAPDREETSAPLVVIPDPEAKYLDPLQPVPTLVLLANLQDARSGEGSTWDVRAVANRALAAFRLAGIADDVQLSSTVPFAIEHGNRLLPNGNAPGLSEQKMDWYPHKQFLIGGIHDPDMAFRNEIMQAAVDSGLGVIRHYRGPHSSSEFLLGQQSLVQACDDHIILRSLFETGALQQSLQIDANVPAVVKSSWSILKNGEPILDGLRSHGLSDLGWYAAGGILKHQLALTAIACASPSIHNLAIARKAHQQTHWQDRGAFKILGVEQANHDPRFRSLVYRGTPANSCPYLSLSALTMAMLDGIVNKIAPNTEAPPDSSATHSPDTIHAPSLANDLRNDADFLLVSDVFSESLVEALAISLSQTRS